MQAILTEIAAARPGVNPNELWVTFTDDLDIKAIVTYQGPPLEGARVIRYDDRRCGKRDVVGIDLVMIRWGWVTFKTRFGSIGADIFPKKMPLRFLLLSGVQVIGTTIPLDILKPSLRPAAKKI